MTKRDPIRIVAIDDSLAVRTFLRRVLDAEPDLKVVGTAVNGKQGLQVISELQPDFLVVDVEMPVMDGITMLQHVRESAPDLPALIFSSVNRSNVQEALDALSKPNTAWLTKPGSEGQTSEKDEILSELLSLVRSLCTAQGKPDTAPAAPLPAPARSETRHASLELLAIGSSTGGPDALVEVLSHLPSSLGVPVVITQHVPIGFSKHIANRLDSHSSLHVHEGQDGTVLEPGHAYLAPAGAHMVLERRITDVVLRTNKDPLVHSCRPAVDPLFTSACEAYEGHVLAVVLTGMGSDGADGCEQVYLRGGRVLIQDEATSVVWGMPGAVHSRGVAHKVLPLAGIAGAIQLELSRSAHKADHQ